MNTLTTKLIATLSIMLSLNFCLSQSAFADDPWPQNSIDDYYEACDRCSKDLDDAILDLKLAKTSAPTPAWYQNEWAIVGLSVITFAVGYKIGEAQNGF